MMALAGVRDLPAVLVPGGVSLPPTQGEDAGKIQTIGVRYAHGLITLQEAAELGCRACATPGGGLPVPGDGGDVAGGGRGAGVVAAALGAGAVGAADLARSGAALGRGVPAGSTSAG